MVSSRSFSPWDLKVGFLVDELWEGWENYLLWPQNWLDPNMKRAQGEGVCGGCVSLLPTRVFAKVAYCSCPYCTASAGQHPACGPHSQCESWKMRTCLSQQWSVRYCFQLGGRGHHGHLWWQGGIFLKGSIWAALVVREMWHPRRAVSPERGYPFSHLLRQVTGSLNCLSI